MSDMDVRICRVQQNIYELAAKRGYDMSAFSEAYLQSDFCKRAFDTIYSRFQTADAEECFDFLLPEIKNVLKFKKESHDIFAGEIGYVYRMLYMLSSVSSSELSKIIPYEAMAKEAYAFDHYGFEDCVKKLMKAYHLPYRKYDAECDTITEQELINIENMYNV